LRQDDGAWWKAREIRGRGSSSGRVKPAVERWPDRPRRPKAISSRPRDDRRQDDRQIDEGVHEALAGEAGAGEAVGERGAERDREEEGDEAGPGGEAQRLDDDRLLDAGEEDAGLGGAPDEGDERQQEDEPTKRSSAGRRAGRD
jgi:hypothetical protein